MTYIKDIKGLSFSETDMSFTNAGEAMEYMETIGNSVHSSSNAYKAGAVVLSDTNSDGNFQFYKADQSVPAGTAITNTSYWTIVVTYPTVDFNVIVNNASESGDEVNATLSDDITLEPVVTGDIATYSWSIPGGTDTPRSIPSTFRFGSTGTHDVTLTITDKYGITASKEKEFSITSTGTVTISNLASARSYAVNGEALTYRFTGIVNQALADIASSSSVTKLDIVAGGTTYSYGIHSDITDNGDGTSSIDFTTPSITLTGAATVTMYIGVTAGGSDSDTISLPEFTLPTVSLNTLVCDLATGQFYVDSSGDLLIEKGEQCNISISGAVTTNSEETVGLTNEVVEFSYPATFAGTDVDTFNGATVVATDENRVDTVTDGDEFGYDATITSSTVGVNVTSTEKRCKFDYPLLYGKFTDITATGGHFDDLLTWDDYSVLSVKMFETDESLDGSDKISIDARTSEQICFLAPTTWGAVTSIIDPEIGTNILSTFTKAAIEITKTGTYGWTQNYYIYFQTSPGTTTATKEYEIRF